MAVGALVDGVARLVKAETEDARGLQQFTAVYGGLQRF